MAPTHNASKPLRSALKKSSKVSDTSASSLFTSTKRDKRHIKHSALLSKITKPSSSKTRRRRPNKKLVTTLDSLASALPDEHSHKPGEPAGNDVQDQINIIRRKSVKSRPGAMKRREKLDQGERERFAKNMAQMSVSTKSTAESTAEQTSGATTTSQKWAALRGFISQTLEQKPEMKSIKG